jgi:hypothetical protein
MSARVHRNMANNHSSCLIELQYLPCITYMDLFFRYREVCIESHEHYQKGTFRNRTYIASPQGRQLLSVPLRKGKHQQAPIQRVYIAYQEPWYARHWHAIQTAYGNAPFFVHYAEDIKDILYSKPGTLFDLNTQLLNVMNGHLRVPGNLTHSEIYEIRLDDIDDLRNTIHPRSEYPVPVYQQVFTDRLGFLSNLSALDLLMHLGPEAHGYLINLSARGLE